MLNSAALDTPLGRRRALRKRLLEQREQFIASPMLGAANTALAHHVADLLGALEPALLGMYSPQRFEFNAPLALGTHATLSKLSLALPFAQRAPVQMHYRAWDGHAPAVLDECGIPSSDGPAVLPDVLLVPCVGFTSSGFRLGYGGGYFDRWLALHPGVTTVGVAWAIGEIDAGAYEAQPHDKPLTLIVTERGVV